MFSNDVRQTRFRISDFQKYDLSISIAPDSNNVFRRVRYPVLFKLIEQFLTVVVVHQHALVAGGDVILSRSNRAIANLELHQRVGMWPRSQNLTSTG